MKPLRSKAVEQSTLSSPLRILAVADGATAIPPDLESEPKGNSLSAHFFGYAGNSLCD